MPLFFAKRKARQKKRRFSLRKEKLGKRNALWCAEIRFVQTLSGAPTRLKVCANFHLCGSFGAFLPRKAESPSPHSEPRGAAGAHSATWFRVRSEAENGRGVARADALPRIYGVRGKRLGGSFRAFFAAEKSGERFDGQRKRLQKESPLPAFLFAKKSGETS